MKMHRTLLIVSIVFIYIALGAFAASAQSFRWGQRGGSKQSAGDAQVETIHDMAVDNRGNIYVLSRVYKQDITVGGQKTQGYGGKDVLLASFDCRGSFRWMKLIGGRNSEYACQVRTDRLDGVYLSFDLFAYNNVGNIEIDSVVPPNTIKRLYRVKDAASGIYQWTRTPEPDTLSS